MAQNFIFTMQDLRKVKGGKEILKGIYLSFFPGAKIGVIGPNGSGKSTLLRIMAGQDSEFFGHAKPDPSIRVGFLPQEPTLENSLDVRGNVELGLKPIRDLLNRFNEISAKFAEPMGDAEMEKLLLSHKEPTRSYQRKIVADMAVGGQSHFPFFARDRIAANPV